MMELRSALRSELRLRDRLADQLPLPPASHCILMDLALARIEGRNVQMTSVASGVAWATTDRHIKRLLADGLIARGPSSDCRAIWLHITDEGFARVSAVFEPPALVRAA